MNEVLALKFLIPTIISMGALFVSHRANKFSKIAAKNSKDIQERIEIYQYYPIISITADAEENKLKLTLRNDSGENSSSEIAVNYVLRISAENHSIGKEGAFTLPAMFPHSEETFFPKEVNELVEHGVIFLSKTDPEKSNFVFNVTVGYSSSHPESRKNYKNYTSFYKYLDGGLKKVKDNRA